MYQRIRNLITLKDNGTIRFQDQEKIQNINVKNIKTSVSSI